MPQLSAPGTLLGRLKRSHAGHVAPNDQLTKQEILQARYRSRLGTRIALVEHTLIGTLYFSLFVWGLAVTDTPEKMAENGEDVTWMIVGTATATMLLAISLSAFAVRFRREPEIRARHYLFLAQLLVSTVCERVCVCVCVWALCT